MRMLLYLKLLLASLFATPSHFSQMLTNLVYKGPHILQCRNQLFRTKHGAQKKSANQGARFANNGLPHPLPTALLVKIEHFVGCS